MRIYDYVTPDRVLIGVRASDAAAALQAVAAPLADSIGFDSADVLYRALLAREMAHTTALDCGVAAPHATVEGVPEPVVMIATAAAPIGFGPAADEPVRLLRAARRLRRLHIRLLARIARVVRRPGLVNQLADSTTLRSCSRIWPMPSRSCDPMQLLVCVINQRMLTTSVRLSSRHHRRTTSAGGHGAGRRRPRVRGTRRSSARRTTEPDDLQRMKTKVRVRSSC